MARAGGRGAVQALVLEAAQAHVVADDVQHAHHLAEDLARCAPRCGAHEVLGRSATRQHEAGMHKKRYCSGSSEAMAAELGSKIL